jgi:putative membrane protein
MRRTAMTAVVILTAAALSAAAARPTPATAARPLDDATIVAIFDAANSWDIETGRLAAERGHAARVRDFGQMLARDHQQVRQQGRDLAKRLGVTPTPPKDFAMAKDHEAAMTTLRALRGEAFDRAFLQHEAAFHKAVIDAVQTTLLPAVSNAELRDFVVKVAPAFDAHMRAAENLEKQLAGR